MRVWVTRAHLHSDECDRPEPRATNGPLAALGACSQGRLSKVKRSRCSSKEVLSVGLWERLPPDCHPLPAGRWACAVIGQAHHPEYAGTVWLLALLAQGRLAGRGSLPLPLALCLDRGLFPLGTIKARARPCSTKALLPRGSPCAGSSLPAALCVLWGTLYPGSAPTAL